LHGERSRHWTAVERRAGHGMCISLENEELCIIDRLRDLLPLGTGSTGSK